MRQASKQDIPALIELWAQCFGDPPAVVQNFFDTLWENILVFTIEDNTSMLTAMPVRWQERDAAYLYAVATHPEHRGQGLCRDLMAYAEQHLLEHGYSYTTLHPAGESLYDFYGAMGYETTFYCEKTMFHGKHAHSVHAVSPDTYAMCRKKFCTDGVEYPRYLLALQEHYGALVEIENLGCAALERTASGWTARELLAKDPETSAKALCHYLHIDSIAVRMPGTEPFAMAKSLDGSPLRRSYLGLAFE